MYQDGGLGDDCGYAISPKFQSFSASGGTGTVNVLSAERCAWQAASNNSWITITSGAAGIGNGSPRFRSFPASGGNGTFDVAAEPRCNWQAMSNVRWISVTSGGNGNGTVAYSVDANTGPRGRTEIVSIDPRSLVVKQKRP